VETSPSQLCVKIHKLFTVSYKGIIIIIIIIIIINFTFVCVLILFHYTE